MDAEGSVGVRRTLRKSRRRDKSCFAVNSRSVSPVGRAGATGLAETVAATQLRVADGPYASEDVLATLRDIAAVAGLRRITMLAWRDLDDPEAGGIAGHSDAVVDGVTGLLVDDPRSLAAAIDRVLRDESLRDRLTTSAVHHASCFTWGATACRTLEVLAFDALRRSRG
jgi:hypothetical protein